MSKTASKPLPSKKTPRKPASLAFRRAAAGDPSAPPAAAEPHDPQVETEEADLLDDEETELEAQAEEELAGGAEDAAEGHTGDDDQIDDPIRIYLMQMGEIPMLSRDEEIAAGQADRVQPQAVPPRHAGDRLLLAGGRRPAGKNSRRPKRGWTAPSRSR